MLRIVCLVGEKQLTDTHLLGVCVVVVVGCGLLHRLRNWTACPRV